MRTPFIALMVIWWFWLAGDASLTPLSAGVAVADITPPSGTRMAGFKAGRTAQSIHDRLYAKILILKSPETSLALIAADLHRFQSPALIERIRRELGIQHVILVASHSYAAPSLDSDS